jgi:hypothetical protein
MISAEEQAGEKGQLKQQVNEIELKNKLINETSEKRMFISSLNTF